MAVLVDVLVLFVWGLVFLAVWLLVSGALTLIAVGPLALFRAWKTARVVAVAVAMLLLLVWIGELAFLLWNGIGFGRRWAGAVTLPIMAVGPLMTAWVITKRRLT